MFSDVFTVYGGKQTPEVCPNICYFHLAVVRESLPGTCIHCHQGMTNLILGYTARSGACYLVYLKYTGTYSIIKFVQTISDIKKHVRTDC